ncbi:hypothetical protein, partial [Endozoicomonas sp. ONNA2]|uniref:hypothetical protein n=1 Tax=Endozoicomonas sp. ONNA2 TaxID=2828741 RepID=UPI0021472F03
MELFTNWIEVIPGQFLTTYTFWICADSQSQASIKTLNNQATDIFIMFHAGPGFNNNVGCSTHLPDASASGIDHCKAPASDTCAFSGERKREVSGRDTTLTFG